jgi:hypothetical protein
MIRRGLLLLVLFALVVSACDTTTDATSTSPAATPASTTTTVASVSTSTSTAATTSTTELDLSGLDLPAAVADQLEALAAETEDLRGLRFLETPLVSVVTPEELEARIRSDIDEVSEDIPADEALYKLFGLLEPEDDFGALLSDLYGEQVAGFYDPDTKEIVVRARDDELSLVEQSTLVHELVHALTDQHFVYNDDYEAMLDEERLDEAAAYQALIEGDASLAQYRWVAGLTDREKGEWIAQSLEEADTEALDNAPEFLTESLLFPYDTGLGFTQALYEAGSWDAVNDAYSVMVDLPGSSEQVITPGDYRRDLPVEVEIPQISIAGYDLERTSVWGEAGFRIMLGQVLGDDTALPAADGWGGDAYHQWFDGTNAAFLLIFEGDTSNDVEELRQALLDFALESVPEEDFVWVDEEGGLLYLIAADETEVGETLRSRVGLG